MNKLLGLIKSKTVELFITGTGWFSQKLQVDKGLHS